MNGHGEPKRAFLIALETSGSAAGGWTAEESLNELDHLVRTAGAVAVGRDVQRRPKADPATYIGRGKAEELRELFRRGAFDMLVVDDELTPVQQRNLEAVIESPIIDRTTVILDIFAERARTREAKLQVELAQLKYRLSRMTGKGIELSRLAGGIGTRGPGESKLEVDRRRIHDRMRALERELSEVKVHRRRIRAERARRALPVVALTGYTNAGKSTLHRVLSGSDVLVEDRLFATLDATARRVAPKDGEPYLLVDTVGFIRKLPTQLVAAFRSTLEEVAEADLVLHVVDASHPRHEEQMEVVEQVLGEIGAQDKPTWIVYNKIDRLGGTPTGGDAPFESGRPSPKEQALPASSHRPSVDWGPVLFPGRAGNSIAVSAALGWNIDALQHAIQAALARRREIVEAVIPFEQTAWVSWAHEQGWVLREEPREDGTYILVELEKSLAAKLRRAVQA